jgi:hypothetical protein
MKKFFYANYKMILAVVLGLNLLVVPVTMAQNLDVWGDSVTDTNGVGLSAFNDIGLGNRDPKRIASAVIQVMLGFLGVIAVILILFGGFKWMTAAGNEDNIDQAKDLITAGVIGLLIVLAAFAVSVFVLNALLGATGANTTPTPQRID